jgi:hypothetical protein
MGLRGHPMVENGQVMIRDYSKAAALVIVGRRRLMTTFLVDFTRNFEDI